MINKPQVNSCVNLVDKLDLHDKLTIINRNGGVTKTKIIMKDHDTGEVLGEFENKILVPGGQISACKQFGLSPVVNFPTYNTALELENSLPPYPATQPFNEPITCLWCAGTSGAGNTGEVFTVANTNRISPKFTTDTNSVETYVDIVPFQYCSPDNDLTEDQRQVYYGRKVVGGGTERERIVYFFKAFDTDPQLHIRYLDGTEVTENMYNIDSSQNVEVYVEMRLAITRTDFREYFDQVVGWDNAYVNCISLLTAWYDDTIPEDPEAPNNSLYYKWYQDIIPFSKFNFDNEKFINLTRALDFNYQVYY